MSTYKNPAVDQGQATPLQAGELVLNRFEFDLAGAYAPSDLNNGDLIQIGVVPAGCKLVPHLCRISVPQLDSDGSPTGDWTLGSTDDPDALKGSSAAETAVVLSGEDFTADTSDLGAESADVKVYLKVVADVATVPSTGVIAADLVVRAFNDRTDADVT